MEDKLFSQLLKEDAAIFHLFNDFKTLGDDIAPAFPIGIQTLDSGGHLALHSCNAAQALKVVHHIQNQRRCRGACRQGPADLPAYK